MKKIGLLFIFLFAFFSAEAAQKQKKYELAVCSITRNDAPYLKEWVDFHLHQGVEHIYIYDNLSEDHPETVLRDYIQKGIVEIIKWNIDHKTRQEWLACQTGAYMDCAKKKKHIVRWCAFIDTDEFLFCPSGQKIPDFLQQFMAYEQIAVNWLIFGTSNVQKAQPGKLVQELLYRTETNRANCCKSIVRLQQAVGCENPHYFLTRNMGLMVQTNKKTIRPDQLNTQAPCFDDLRIHHYTYRDLDFFYNTKIARVRQQGKDPKDILEYEKTFNKVRDESILKCLPKSKGKK